MSSRIDNVGSIPPVLPPLPVVQPNRLPERYYSAKPLEPNVQQIVDRLVDAVRVVKAESEALRSLGLLTADDLRGLVVMSDAELVILNAILAGNVLTRLASVEDRLTAGGL